jgi:hypothetical protein
MRLLHKVQVILLLLVATSCHSQPNQSDSILAKQEIKQLASLHDTTIKTIHVYVALCDNKYQGIVPVPKLIGNGQDPFNNLYWGCGYGVKTYFKKSAEWVLVKTIKDSGHVLERCVFKNKLHPKTYLVADAYNGAYIKQCTVDFLRGTAGIEKDTLTIDGKTIGTKGNAALTAYIGHNGLMDFSIELNFDNADGKTRDAIMLACKSKNYFQGILTETGANPLVWTTGLMAPEAYTLHDAISAWLANQTDAQVRLKAAAAYHKYQKCSEKAAKNLLVTGW